MELKGENDRLKQEMNALKERIAQLSVAHGAACPLCGQPLSEQHRIDTLAGLEADGKTRGDTHRANRAALDSLTGEINAMQARIQELAPAEAERLAASGRVMQLSERLEALRTRSGEWEKGGAKRLKELAKLLAGEKFALEARKRLARGQGTGRPRL